MTRAMPYSESIPLEGEHWQFALALYGQDGVSPACLLLQDERGVDVNILLLSLFAIRQWGAAPSRSDIEALIAETSWVRENLVLPLRQTRRALRAPPSELMAASRDLKSSIQKAEIKAEQLEQAILAVRLATRHDGFRVQDPREAVHLVIEASAASSPPSPRGEVVDQAISVLLDAYARLPISSSVESAE